MKAVWLFYIILGMGFVFCIYMTSLGTMQWWYIVYYIILGFLGVLGIWSHDMRWKFLLGIVLGMLLLIALYKFDKLNYSTRMPIVREFYELY